MRRFEVTIRYREPTYEKHAGAVPGEPYRACYQLDARDERRAREAALEAFQRDARLSGSGWVREVIAVEVRPVD